MLWKEWSLYSLSHWKIPCRIGMVVERGRSDASKYKVGQEVIVVVTPYPFNCYSFGQCKMPHAYVYLYMFLDFFSEKNTYQSAMLSLIILDKYFGVIYLYDPFSLFNSTLRLPVMKSYTFKFIISNNNAKNR